MVIVEENQGYSNIIGNSQAPYINNLATPMHPRRSGLG